MLQANLLKSKALAVGWLMVMNILFVLPGSALPKSNWMTDWHVDKWVHIGLFAVLIFLWCRAFEISAGKKLIVIISAIAYGILVEVVQKTWVPNRSFDLYDVAADAAGSLIGLFVWLRVKEKNKPL